MTDTISGRLGFVFYYTSPSINEESRGSKLEAGTEAETMDEGRLLALSLWLSAFLVQQNLLSQDHIIQHNEPRLPCMS